MERFAALAHEAGSFPVHKSHLATVLAKLFESQIGWDKGLTGELGLMGPDYADRVSFVRQIFKVNIPSTASADVLQLAYSRWSSFADAVNRRAPSGLKMLMVSRQFNAMLSEQVIFQSTIVAFTTSLGITLVSVLVFTGNVLIACFSLVNTLLSTSCLFGIIISVLQHEFG